MIIVHEAKVIMGGTILMKIETTQGHIIDSFLLCDKDEFGDYSKSHDMSSFLKKQSNTEILVIPAENNPIDMHTDIMFFEITSDEPKDNKITGAIYNMSRYVRCMIDFLYKEIDGDNCGCSVKALPTGSTAILVDLLIKKFELYISYGEIQSAKTTLKELDDICKKASNCGCKIEDNLTKPCTQFKQF